MENKKNLFVINSPLQLLNSIEAIYKFELKNIIIVAIYNRSIKNIEQIEAQLGKINCDEIVRFNPLKEGKLQGFKIKMNTINNGEETVTVSYNKSKSTNFPFIQKDISNTKIK